MYQSQSAESLTRLVGEERTRVVTTRANEDALLAGRLRWQQPTYRKGAAHGYVLHGRLRKKRGCYGSSYSERIPARECSPFVVFAAEIEVNSRAVASGEAAAPFSPLRRMLPCRIWSHPIRAASFTPAIRLVVAERANRAIPCAAVRGGLVCLLLK